MREAFRGLQSVERWYRSPSPRSGMQPKNAEPTWRLEEIGGAIDDTGTILEQNGPLVDSISAARGRSPV